MLVAHPATSRQQAGQRLHGDLSRPDMPGPPRGCSNLLACPLCVLDHRSGLSGAGGLTNPGPPGAARRRAPEGPAAALTARSFKPVAVRPGPGRGTPWQPARRRAGEGRLR